MDSSLPLKRESLVYTSCYCEENIWKLCEYVRDQCADKLSQCFAVFISNPQKTVPVWCQRAQRRINEPVMWDYHVILVYKGAKRDGQSPRTLLVYDLDTTLEFPCDFSKYVKQSFGDQRRLRQSQVQCFRVVTAQQYLERFASDRSHMLKNGKWLAQPPSYAPLVASTGETNNIADFISMDPQVGVGTVCPNVAAFVTFMNT